MLLQKNRCMLQTLPSLLASLTAGVCTGSQAEGIYSIAGSQCYIKWHIR